MRYLFIGAFSLFGLLFTKPGSIGEVAPQFNLPTAFVKACVVTENSDSCDMFAQGIAYTSNTAATYDFCRKLDSLCTRLYVPDDIRKDPTALRAVLTYKGLCNAKKP